MKKSFITALALVLVIGLSGPAFAAVSPYSDVPADHWAYDAVKQLSNAGIVEGYSDGTYRGQKTITRYEMAIITANAMTKFSQADAEQKALIEKLANEFNAELKAQNTRLTALEDKVDKAVKLSGTVRESYEWDKDYDSKLYTHVEFDVTAPLTDSLFFKGRVTAENKAGNGPVATGLGYTVEGSQVINVDQAFIVGKALGFDTFLLGRVPFAFGQGLLASSEEAGWPRGACDGIILGNGNKLKYVVAAGRLGLRDYVGYTGNDYYDRVSSSFSLQGYMLTYPVNKDVTLWASMLNSRDRSLYESTSIALNYKGIKNIEISSEFGQNDSDYAVLNNNGDAAKAWFAKVKYKGADRAKDHSYGFWAAYRKADSYFDPMGLGAAGFIRTTHYLKGEMTNGMNFGSDIKGYDCGFEMTVFKDAILSLQYGDYENKNGDAKAKNFMTTLECKF
jgi:hypothetical protein